MPVPPVAASIVYWRNYTDDDNAYVEDKTTSFILSIETVGFEAPAGYEFQEWNTARDGGGYSMSAGDAPAASEVYAIWKEAAQDPYYLTKESELTSVADAIRAKGGTSDPLAFPAGFVSAINAIPAGGGVTNIVSGSFIGAEPGQAMDITLPYAGNGYPIIVYALVDGAGSNTGFKNRVQQYAVYSTFLFKSIPNEPPTYTYKDMAGFMRLYKMSATSATSYSTSGNASIGSFWDDANATSNNWIKVRSATKMSVYIANPSSFGFAANVEYNYLVVYSE